MSIDALKRRVRKISSNYRDREERARRLFIEERAESLSNNREIEFEIRRDTSVYFGIPHSSVSFCGSAQLGFSIHKDTIFTPGRSDLDIACVSQDLFQYAWIDISKTTRSFRDLSKFGSRSLDRIELFKSQILRRGMISVDLMPYSNTHREWVTFQDEMSRKYNQIFSRVSFAIYMNEYAFCWKQDTSLSQLVK